MSTYKPALVALILTVSLAGTLFAVQPPDRSPQVIVRAGASDMAAIAEQYGVTILAESGRNGHKALVAGPATMTAEQLRDLMTGDPRIESLDLAMIASLPTDGGVTIAAEEAAPNTLKVGDFTTPCLGQGFGELLWSGYADQEMMAQVHLHEAQAASRNCGDVVVAVLDTGVDPQHPLLEGALLPGYDLVYGAAGKASEWTELQGSVTGIIEGSVTGIIEGSVTGIIEQENIAVLEGRGDVEVVNAGGGPILASTTIEDLLGLELPPSFGHGTMVAALVRLAAPNAKILPIRIFDGAGNAHVYDVVEAIYYAVDSGADVINMSFSLHEGSKELRRAIEYAAENGVVTVAAAGNQGQRTRIFPAALNDTIGVASVTDADVLSEFSNFGDALVDVAAPGHGVVSAYPGGLYAAGWGTSFSTPVVAGTVALMVKNYPGQRDVQMVRELTRDLREGAERLSGQNEIGAGRLNALAAVNASAN